MLWRGPADVDILLAPPRIEMAEMVLIRDLEKTLSLMRRLYDLVIVDTGVGLDELTLALLDQADTILEIVTYDATTIRNTIAMAETFQKIGYPPSKVQYLVNRADAAAGIDPADLRAGPRPRAGVQDPLRGPDRRPASNQGAPFVTADPDAGVSKDVVEVARSCSGVPRPSAALAGARSGGHRGAGAEQVTDPRPIGVFDPGVGGLTVLREILRRTPGESTIYFGDNARAPYGTRPDEEVRAFSTESIDALVERDVKAVVVACNTSTAIALGDLRRRYDLPILGVIRPGRDIGLARHPEPPGRRHRHAGDDPLARLLRRDQGREPGGRGLRARDADVRADGRGRPARGRRSRRASGRRWRRSSASATRPASSSSRCRRRARSTRSSSAAPTTRCSTGDRGGRGGGDRDRGLRVGDGLRAGRAALDQRAGGARRHGASHAHVQLTTGDVDAFRSIAERMFGEAFPTSSGRCGARARAPA